MSTDDAKKKDELVLAWLHDALAMENALAVVLKHRISDAKDFPALEAIDRQHLSETLNHADLVRRCIARRGAKPSTAKSLFGTIFGAVQAPMTAFARDEIVKNCLVDYAAEQFEVASYAALIAAAKEIGDAETAQVCEQIMNEDQAMADRIMANLPAVIAAQLGNPSAVPVDRASSGELLGQPRSMPDEDGGAAP